MVATAWLHLGRILVERSCETGAAAWTTRTLVAGKGRVVPVPVRLAMGCGHEAVVVGSEMCIVLCG